MTLLIDHMTNMNAEEKLDYLKIEQKFQCCWCNRIMDSKKDDATYQDSRGPGKRKTSPGKQCRDCKSTLFQYGRAIRSLHWMEVKSLLSCVYCGLSNRPVCMEFDHYDSLGKINVRNIKSLSVSYFVTNGTSSYPNTFFEEILKCTVICSNCHSEKTKHEATYEDSYKSEKVLSGDYKVGNGGIYGNGNNGARRKTPTCGELVRSAVPSPWTEGTTINKELHERNLKIIYDKTFSYFMSGKRSAWDTGIVDENGKSCVSDYWNWKWKITPSQFGARGDVYVRTRAPDPKIIVTGMRRAERQMRDNKLAEELLDFDWEVRMGREMK